MGRGWGWIFRGFGYRGGKVDGFLVGRFEGGGMSVVGRRDLIMGIWGDCVGLFWGLVVEVRSLSMESSGSWGESRKEIFSGWVGVGGVGPTVAEVFFGH
jgi:hypothetical protein